MTGSHNLLQEHDPSDLMTFLLKVPPSSNTTTRNQAFITHLHLSDDHLSHRIPLGPLLHDKTGIHLNSLDLQSQWQGSPAGGRKSPPDL